VAKKVLYFIRTFAHRRVFESYSHRDDINQLVLGPKSKVIDGVLEDYSTFGIKNIKTYSNPKETQSIINQFNPDIFVQADFPDRIKLPPKCKRVFVAHGLVGNHVNDLFPPGSMNMWDNFDLYCGGSANFADG